MIVELPGSRESGDGKGKVGLILEEGAMSAKYEGGYLWMERSRCGVQKAQAGSTTHVQLWLFFGKDSRARNDDLGRRVKKERSLWLVLY